MKSAKESIFRILIYSRSHMVSLPQESYQKVLDHIKSNIGNFFTQFVANRIEKCKADQLRVCELPAENMIIFGTAFLVENQHTIWTARHVFDPFLADYSKSIPLNLSVDEKHEKLMKMPLDFILFGDDDETVLFDTKKDDASFRFLGNPDYF